MILTRRLCPDCTADWFDVSEDGASSESRKRAATHFEAVSDGTSPSRRPEERTSLASLL